MSVNCVVSRSGRLCDQTGKIYLETPLAWNNALAHAMRYTALDDAWAAADLTGIGVTGSFLRADGETVEPINGTVTGNVAEVILPPPCYVIPGHFKFTMHLTDQSGATRSVMWVEGTVERNTSTAQLDPGTPITNISQAIGQANAAASAANSAAAAAQEVVDNIEGDVSAIADDVTGLKDFSTRFLGAADKTITANGLTIKNVGRQYTVNGTATEKVLTDIDILAGTIWDDAGTEVIHLKKGHTYHLGMYVSAWPTYTSSGGEFVKYYNAFTLRMVLAGGNTSYATVCPGKGMMGFDGTVSQYYCDADKDVRLRLVIDAGYIRITEDIQLQFNSIKLLIGLADVTSMETIFKLGGGQVPPVTNPEFNGLSLSSNSSINFLGNGAAINEWIAERLYKLVIYGENTLSLGDAHMNEAALANLLSLPKIQYGTGTTDSSTGILDVEFDTPFSETPVVILTPRSGTNSNVANTARLVSVTASGFRCIGVSVSTTSSSQTVTIRPDANRDIRWLAIGT